MNIFEFIPHTILQLSDVLGLFKNSDAQALAKLDAVIEQLESHIQQKSDAALAAIHLVASKSPLKQVIDGTILASLIANSLEYDATKKQTLLRAALTANFSFIDMQVLLHDSEKPLSDEQAEKIRQHPLNSAALIQSATISDSHWINIIYQHHERLDGSGYPNGLTGDDILEEAMILNLTEFYTSLVDHRAYRKAMLPKEALRIIHHQDNERPDYLNQAFIRMIGIYPPGTFVQLANKEIAIVIERIPKQVMPKVKALFDPKGAPYMGALERNTTESSQRIIKPCEPPKQPLVDLISLWD